MDRWGGIDNVHVVGFSIGAMVAIKIAAARPDRVGRLTLISPAAPLSLGDFLPHMAGNSIFQLAQSRPRMLKFLTKVQGLVSIVMPNFLIGQLFRKSGQAERALLDDPVFRDVIKDGFANAFRRHPDQYISLLRRYVGDWSHDLTCINCPVDIWHGDNDTWSPIAMSHALRVALGANSTLHVVKNGEHYTTLKAAILAK